MLILRSYPRSKGFHSDVSAGCFALFYILGVEFGYWEVGKLETAIALDVFSILQYADLEAAAVVAPQFGNSQCFVVVELSAGGDVDFDG